LWVLVLASSRAYEPRFVGVGSEEFKRVTSASLRVLALLTMGAFAAKAELSRGFVFVALPLGTVLLLLGRFGCRKVLHRLRLYDRCIHRVVAVGSRDEVETLTTTLRRDPYAGLMVVAASLPDYETQAPQVDGVDLPLLSPARGLAARLHEVGADTVAVVGSTALSSRELRELAWDLEGMGIDLVVAPSLTDVTGPRIHVRPVAGLPLLHLEEPTFGGIRRVIKAVIDYVGALVISLLLLIPGVIIAVAIKRNSPGPVFYRQERVGKDGGTFLIWKFRTMRVGADAEVAALAAMNEHDGPMFKIRSDPRITSVGGFLRKYSLDELPQILNVLTGSMSLVGPRPPLAREVAKYADHVHRRLLVKPGMTGLWQVSGRSDLDWEETVRLDLYYVENWSVAMDAMILWKTVFAVLKGHGAY
jgi:exopolysaccharide biosynthesis polyprenyl glycosylphosphotransferase